VFIHCGKYNAAPAITCPQQPLTNPMPEDYDAETGAPPRLNLAAARDACGVVEYEGLRNVKGVLGEVAGIDC
jgi:hypothetical protein